MSQSRKKAMNRVPRGNRPSATGQRRQRAELANAEAYEAARKTAAQLPLLPPPPKRDPIGELLTGVAPTLFAATKVRRAQAMAELEAAEAKEAAELAARPPVLFIPGDLVCMTAKWLRFAYGTNKLGNANYAPSEEFTVQACPCEGCSSGRLVAVPHVHPQMIEWYGPLRHILATNVEHAQLAPAGPIRKEDRDAVLAQVGMRLDDDGNWFLRPPWEL